MLRSLLRGSRRGDFSYRGFASAKGCDEACDKGVAVGKKSSLRVDMQ